MNDNIDPEFGPQPWSGLPAQLRPIPGETLEAFEGFVCYFNLGHERSLRLVAKKLDASIDTVKEWSSKHHWVDRIFSYEAQLFGKCVAAKARSAEEQAAAKSNAEAQFSKVGCVRPGSTANGTSWPGNTSTTSAGRCTSLMISMIAVAWNGLPPSIMASAITPSFSSAAWMAMATCSLSMSTPNGCGSPNSMPGP